MGVQHIFLDAGMVVAHQVWTSHSMGFSCISERQFNDLELKFTLVVNRGDIVSRLMKPVPSHALVMFQVSTVVTIMLVGFYIGSRPSGISQTTFCTK